MTNDKTENWNPLDPAILEDQRKAYDEMRERCPVAHSKFLGWSLFRHADIKAVLADPQTFSNTSRFLAIPNGLNPPVHGRYNSAIGAFFGPAQMAALEPRLHELAPSHLKPLLSGGEVELIGSFITPFTLQSLCALLGWPVHLWNCLAGWLHGNQQVAFRSDPVAGKALAELFATHVKRNLDSHRNNPPANADATAQLLSTEVDGKGFTDDEIVSILRNWAAGHGTTADGLGIVIFHLAEDAKLQQRLRKNLSLVPAAIEEILRADGPLVANRRTATHEVEIGGTVIPKDETLTLMWIAANRDPRAFEDPATVKLERNTDDSLVWGQGIHLCLGAPLARLEMRVAVEALLSSTGSFALAGDAPARKVYPGNGLVTLPLRFN